MSNGVDKHSELINIHLSDQKTSLVTKPPLIELFKYFIDQNYIANFLCQNVQSLVGGRGGGGLRLFFYKAFLSLKALLDSITSQERQNC